MRAARARAVAQTHRTQPIAPAVTTRGTRNPGAGV